MEQPLLQWQEFWALLAKTNFTQKKVLKCWQYSKQNSADTVWDDDTSLEKMKNSQRQKIALSAVQKCCSLAEWCRDRLDWISWIGDLSFVD